MTAPTALQGGPGFEAFASTWTIGCAGSGADIEIHDDPEVLSRHALLALDHDGGWWIAADDAGRVRLNGTPVTTAAPIGQDNVLELGSTIMTISPDLLEAGTAALPASGTSHAVTHTAPDTARQSAARQGLAVDLAGVSVTTTTGKTLLNNASFTVEEGQIVAIVGPSGAGKSSLTDVILGESAHHVSGEVRVSCPGQAGAACAPRDQIRFVPQSEALYDDLTVQETLIVAAQIRDRAPIASRPELVDASPTVDQRVGKVIAVLGLGACASNKVSQLSGGQRKRLSLGVELVGQPRLLIADEPSSGLDLALDDDIMRALWRASRDLGCTVIVITHTTTHLPDYTDKIIALDGAGRVVHDGPPPALTDREWCQRLRDLGEKSHRQGGIASPGRPRGARPPSQSTWRDWVTMAGFTIVLQRQWMLLRRRGLKTLLLQCLATPLLLSFVAIIASDDGLRAGPDASKAIATLVIGAGLTGSLISFLDLVQERAVLHKDHRVGVSAASILAAKSLVFSAVCAVIALTVTLVYGGVRPLPPAQFGIPPIAVLFIAIFAAMCSSLTIGLLISALSSTFYQATLLNTWFMVLQVVLHGSIFPLPSWLELPTAVLPARLGYASMASYMNLSGGYQADRDPLWTHSLDHLGMLLLWSMVLFILSAAAAAAMAELRWRGRLSLPFRRR
ncbi:ATP-binding cassette domain-containing protein [Nonomuraea sp. NPDC049400]|uniref:ATP-binding cassette domain-containing protein n=1 Tax=Nonomuraea sp. NPDC049400 TaxID=3364352 RepID=UPI0037BA0184